MAEFKIDKKLCKGDGRCVEVCPMQILKLNEKDKTPEFILGGAEICINCGHCFASCPFNAIKLAGLNSDSTVKLDPANLPNPKQVEMFLKGRRSIRLYQDKPVSKDSIEKLLDIARYAPSGINRQPVNWAVVMGKENIYQLGSLVVKWMENLIAEKSPMAEALRFERLVLSWKKGEDLICRNAPCVVIAYGIKDDPMVPQACTISATYLELAAFGLGFGACWAGYVNIAINTSLEVRKFVGLSSRAYAGGTMMLGYPKYEYSSIPARNPAKIIWK